MGGLGFLGGFPHWKAKKIFLTPHFAPGKIVVLPEVVFKIFGEAVKVYLVLLKVIFVLVFLKGLLGIFFWGS